MLKTIIFDLGGVLIDLDKKACIAAFRQLGFHDIDQYLGEYIQQGFFMDLEEGKISVQEYYNEVRRHCARPELTDEEINRAWYRILDGLPVSKLDLLRKLRKTYQVFALSNTNDIALSYFSTVLFAQQGLTIHDYFDRLFLSHQMGCAKPDAEIFKKMIRESCINPAEALFLDDAESNIATARTLGFQTYLVKPHEDFRQLFEALNPRGK
jgi:putative hydrolase of the HAD superfamily